VLSTPTVYISSWIATPDRDGRVVDLSLRDQTVQHLRRTILHLIDVDGGVSKNPWPLIKSEAQPR
jgi:hypothetical protein